MVKMRLSHELRDFLIRLTLTYEEHYVLFNEDGDTALLSKDMKKKLLQHDIECKEVYLAQEHHFLFGIRMPSKLEGGGTFYHATESLTARISYKLDAKLFLRASIP